MLENRVNNCSIMVFYLTQFTVVFLLSTFFFYHIYEVYLEISRKVASELMTCKEMPDDLFELGMDYRVLVMPKP